MTTNHDDNGDFALMPGNDPLDSLLRDWHAENAGRAADLRDKLMDAVRAAKNTLTPALSLEGEGAVGADAKRRLGEHSTGRSAHSTLTPALSLKGEGVKANRFARFTPAIAASMAFAATLGLLFTTVGPHAAQARGDVIMAPDGGRLDAVNARGELIGPCPLKHTDVHVDVSGSFARVTLQQRYGNPYADKIEAVYTFPMSHRGAVDRMTMTIGDRVVVGEVKEREAARATYEAAKSAGHAAALLEQERPNIFTQSVANIEPGVEIVVEISYVELLEARDGLFGFTFPMVVAPRYIPGGDDSSKLLPAGLQHREGLNLLAPATLTITANGDTSQNGLLTAEVINALLTDAVPIEPPPVEYWTSHYPTTGQPAVWHQFEIGYMDGQREAGVLYTDGLGQINGRWFFIDAGSAPKPAAGTGFAGGTAQVPDAARITPQPVKPTTRAGHDISITVNIDTGGPGITDLKSELHAIQQNWGGMRTDGTPSQVAVSLNEGNTIPNQDFVLHWRQTADTITEQVFTHADARGGFITLILNPPARVENNQAVPRELVFVLDTSGSMQGFPIEKAKEVMTKAIAALRPQDTFNLITFAGDTRILWDRPQAATADKLAEAQQFLSGQQGGGGTEMMTAINAALEVKPESRQLAPGEAAPVRIVCFMTDGEVGNDMQIIDAVKKNAATTRVFSFGIGNSVNRYLLDGIARAGRGAAEYVLLSEGADEKVASFSQRIQSPVLMDVQMQFSGDIEVVDRVPEELPDLYDVAPVIVHARYTKGGKGSVTLRGNAGNGPYEKTIELDLPEAQAEHDVIATLWAREKVEQLMNRDLAAAQSGNFPADLKKQVIDLGETFQIMTQYTSFVAVENLRVTVGGQPRLVPVPIELPEGQSWEGTMGEAVNKWADQVAPDDLVLGRRLSGNGIPQLGDIPAIGGLFDGTQQEVADKLKQPTGEINLDGVSFEQAVNQLRDQSGVNIVVNWDALGTAAIEKDKEVSLHVNAGTVSLETALKLLTETVGGGEVELGSQIGDGVVQISTKEDLAKRTTVVVYNVEDLIQRVSEFQTKPPSDSSQATTNLYLYSDALDGEKADASASEPIVYHLKHKTAHDIGFTIEDLLKPKDGGGPVFDEGPNERILIGKNISPQQREKVRKLIEMFDQPGDSTGADVLEGDPSDASSTGLMVHHLKHKTAYDIAFTIEDLLKPKSGTGPTLDEGPDEKTLIVRGFKPSQKDTISKMIEMFDQPGDSSGDDFVLTLDAKDIPQDATSTDLMVHHLKHKTAYDIAFTLEDLMKPKSGTGPSLDEGPDEKTLIVKGFKPSQKDAINKMIEMFDQPGDSSGDDGVLSLDAKNIPADVLARTADEIRKQSNWLALSSMDPTKAKELISKLQQPVAGDGLGDASNRTPERDAKSTQQSAPQGLLAATEEALIPSHQDALLAGDGINAQQQEQLRRQHTNREGKQLYFEGRKVPSNMEIPSNGATLSKKGTDIFRIAGRKNESTANLDGFEKQPIARPPGQPPPPESLGRQYKPKVYGMIAGEAAAEEQSRVAEYRFGAAGEAPSDGVTRLRAGYMSTTPTATPGSDGQATNLGQSVQPSDSTAGLRLAGIKPMPMAQPRVHPQARFRGGFYGGRENVYVQHNEANAPIADTVAGLGFDMPQTQTGSGGGETSDADNQVFHFSFGWSFDGQDDGTSRQPSKTPVLGDIPGIGSAFVPGATAAQPEVKDMTGDGLADVYFGSDSYSYGDASQNRAPRKPPIPTCDLPSGAVKSDYGKMPSLEYMAKPVQRGAAPAPMLIDQLLVRAAALARAGRLEASMAVVEAILKAGPASSQAERQGVFAVASAMRDVLTNGVLTNGATAMQVCQLAAGAAQQLSATAERARMLAKRLDERLLRLALGDASPEALAGLDAKEGAVLVSVLVDAFGDGTQAALTKAGLKIESTSKPTRVVIGRIAPKRLGDLATCKHVRRVEAVKVR